jgi:1-acyl-sn-glycerol-3-phosphate acyltransferase
MTDSRDRSYFWFFSLGAAFVPFIIPEHVLVVPLAALGLLWEPAWGWATHLNRLMFRIVLGAQPWYRADLSISLPPTVASGERGCLVVANHRSHLDVFLLFRELTHLRVVAKDLLYYVPFYGHLMPVLKMIKVHSQDPASYLTAMEKVRRGLVRGHRVAVFPEMTRCEPGALATRKFQRAPFHAAREAGVLVQPVAFWGTDAVWGKGSQRISRGPKVYARSLEPVDPRAFPDSAACASHVQRMIDEAVLVLRSQAIREAAP